MNSYNISRCFKSERYEENVIRELVIKKKKILFVNNEYTVWIGCCKIENESRVYNM